MRIKCNNHILVGYLTRPYTICLRITKDNFLRPNADLIIPTLGLNSVFYLHQHFYQRLAYRECASEQYIITWPLYDKARDT